MKIALIYFTGTGVTAKFASEIAKGFDTKEHQYDLIRLKKGKAIDVSSYDIIGLGSPAYSFRAPWIVNKLLRKINFQRKAFFLFCTSGGMPGNTLWNLYYTVKRTAGFCLGYIHGSGTTNLRSWMPHFESSRDSLWGLSEFDNTRANEFAKIILERYQQTRVKKSYRTNREWIPKPRIEIILWSWMFTWRWQMAFTVGFKRVDKEKCTKCKLCATKICPSGAITLRVDNTPKFNEFLCVGCNGCVNLCPPDAIWTYQTKNHLQYDLYKKFIFQEENQ